MKRRKSPIRHKVKQYKRKGRPVQSHVRGKGRRVVVKKKIKYTGKAHELVMKHKKHHSDIGKYVSEIDVFEYLGRPKYVYHGTTIEGWREIQKLGYLKPNEAGDVYVSPKLWHSRSFARGFKEYRKLEYEPKDVEGVVLKLDAKSLRLYSSIPHSDIELVHKGRISLSRVISVVKVIPK